MSKNRGEFQHYHPLVNYIYYTVVIVFSMFLMQPITQTISILSAFCYSMFLNGRRETGVKLALLLPLIVITALINPLFNHNGATVIITLPNGVSFTAEAVIFGVFAGVMLATVILWFSCFNKVMTSDKLMYLLGRVMPALSLVFSMTLRFVPRFKKQFIATMNAQRGITPRYAEKSTLKKAKSGIKILSGMTSWSFESAIDTADSMKSRGYGLKGRTSFSIFSFTKRDWVTLGILIFLIISILVLAGIGCFDFEFYPNVDKLSFDILSISGYVMYFILCIIPMIIEKVEEVRWKGLK